MKKIIIILVFCKLFTSCFILPLAPHSHSTKCLDKSNSKIKISIACFPKYKYYNISGTEKNDSVYISSLKKIKNNNFCKTKYLFKDTVKSYILKIGDSNFHNNLLNDTIKVTIKKNNSITENFYFFIEKDSKIRN